ncbi:phosphate ABC transporter substrate-binding protein, PhoT family, partial [Streptomyces sp. NPDC056121]
MRRARRAAAALTLTIALAAVGTLTSQAQPDNDAKDFSTWAVAPQKAVTPQTDDQDAYNKAHGRPLPERELLQPALDSGLSSYKA